MKKPDGLYLFESLFWGWRIGRISRLLGLWRRGWSLGWCYRCKTCWTFIPHHVTNYSPGCGCFPLCEPCWKELTIEDRLPYYRKLYEQWLRDDYRFFDNHTPETWNQIEQAVRNGG